MTFSCGGGGWVEGDRKRRESGKRTQRAGQSNQVGGVAASCPVTQKGGRDAPCRLIDGHKGCCEDKMVLCACVLFSLLPWLTGWLLLLVEPPRNAFSTKGLTDCCFLFFLYSLPYTPPLSPLPTL